MIDWSFRVGDLITLFGFAGSGLFFVLMLKGDLKVLAVKVVGMDATLAETRKKVDDLGQLLALFGRYEERMTIMRRDIEDLRRGRGLIVDPPHERD